MTLRPGPWVDPERHETRPWETHDGIIKFIEFPVRIATMSHRAFHLYWQRHHSPNVMNATPFAQFMRKYNSSHRFTDEIPELPARLRQTTDWEGGAEVWVNSLTDTKNWLAHPWYADLVQPDEPRFIAQDGRVRIIVGKEEPVLDAPLDWPEEGRVKLYICLMRKNSIDRATFHPQASAYARRLSQALGAPLCKATITHRLCDPYPFDEAGVVDIDAVIELWFESRRALANACSALGSDAWLRQEAEFCDPTLTRALVGKVRVVHDEFSFQPSTMQPIPFTWEEP